MSDLITDCFIDCDPVAYKGATSKEKVRYHFEREVDGVKELSPIFPNAKDAADFLVTQELMDEHEGWERIATKDVPKIQEVLDATQTVLNDYMNTAKKLTGNPNLRFHGLLTPSGRKSKDIDGLEQMYQCNRDDSNKPVYLKQAREHLLTSNSWIKMAKKGYEADCQLMAMTERKSKKGVVMFIDKDLRGVEGTHYIDMNDDPVNRKLVYSPEGLGELFVIEKSKKTVKGHGFIWELFLGIAGDRADGYNGLKGFGEMKVLKLLEDCKTKEEALQVTLDLYKTKFPNGIKYVPNKYPEDRPQKEQERTAYELLEQHLNLSFQERKPNKLFKLLDYIGEE